MGLPRRQESDLAFGQWECTSPDRTRLVVDQIPLRNQFAVDDGLDICSLLRRNQAHLNVQAISIRVYLDYSRIQLSALIDEAIARTHCQQFCQPADQSSKGQARQHLPLQLLSSQAQVSSPSSPSSVPYLQQRRPPRQVRAQHPLSLPSPSSPWEQREVRLLPEQPASSSPLVDRLYARVSARSRGRTVLWRRQERGIRRICEPMGGFECGRSIA